MKRHAARACAAGQGRPPAMGPVRRRYILPRTASRSWPLYTTLLSVESSGLLLLLRANVGRFVTFARAKCCPSRERACPRQRPWRERLSAALRFLEAVPSLHVSLAGQSSRLRGGPKGRGFTQARARAGHLASWVAVCHLVQAVWCSPSQQWQCWELHGLLATRCRVPSHARISFSPAVPALCSALCALQIHTTPPPGRPPCPCPGRATATGRGHLYLRVCSRQQPRRGGPQPQRRRPSPEG